MQSVNKKKGLWPLLFVYMVSVAARSLSIKTMHLTSAVVALVCFAEHDALVFFPL